MQIMASDKDCSVQRYLLCLEDLLVGEENLIPNHLHPLLCVHGQRGAFHTGDITLAYLQGADGNA